MTAEHSVTVSRLKREVVDVEKNSPVQGETVFEIEERDSVKVVGELEEKFEDDAMMRSKFPSAFRSQIPDAKTVYEARKKRERMRLTGSDGYIPLDDVQRLQDKSVARSRLVREDDNDVSDEEAENGRFYSSKHEIIDEEDRKRTERFDFLAAEQGDGDANEQSDEEVSRWEREQMMKGVSSYKVELLEQERAKMDAMTRAIRLAVEMPPDNRVATPMEMDVDLDEPIASAAHARGYQGSRVSHGVAARRPRAAAA